MPGPATFIVECFWSGVDQPTVDALNVRATSAANALAASGHAVRFVGSILLPDDEVVLCEFEGTEPLVRRAVEAAEIPFARIVKSARSPRVE